MPLIIEKEWMPDSVLGIWKSEEGEESFMEKMELGAGEKDLLGKINGRRRREWLSSRWLIHQMTGEEKRIPCIVDQFGKPHLSGSETEISISHSGDYVAAIFSDRPVGIDIQRLVPKIGRIEKKFMREEESESLDPKNRIDHLHVYWGAKESMYKAYGRKELDFRQNISILPFHFQSSGIIKGIVRKNEFFAEYTIYYEKFENLMLVGARES